MSSKRAAAEGSKELLFDVLRLIARYGLHDEELAKEFDVKLKRQVYFRTKYAERRGYITRTKNIYSLSSAGKNILSEREVWELAIPTPKQWDKKWRLVLFDIPKDRRKRRDVFRLRLKELGLVLYQDSVWVYPYPLEKNLRQIADFYRLSPCVSFAVAERLTGEKKLK